MNHQPHDLTQLLHQLCNPRIDILTRDPAGTDPDVDAEATADQATADQLRAQHAQLLARPRQAPQARKVLERLIAHERRREARRTARGEQPSLLDQLDDAVASSQGGGRRAAGLHRAPIGLAAADVLAGIERTVGRGPRPELGRRVWAWAGEHATEPATLTTVAGWVASALAVLQPTRSLDLVAACPVCGSRTVHVDDAGERVRRPALQVDQTTGWARCHAPGCGAEWPPSRLQLLASVLEQQATEQATEQHQTHQSEGSAA